MLYALYEEKKIKMLLGELCETKRQKWTRAQSKRMLSVSLSILLDSTKMLRLQASKRSFKKNLHVLAKKLALFIRRN